MHLFSRYFNENKNKYQFVSLKRKDDLKLLSAEYFIDTNQDINFHHKQKMIISSMRQYDGTLSITYNK